MAQSVSRRRIVLLLGIGIFVVSVLATINKPGGESLRGQAGGCNDFDGSPCQTVCCHSICCAEGEVCHSDFNLCFEPDDGAAPPPPPPAGPPG